MSGPVSGLLDAPTSALIALNTYPYIISTLSRSPTLGSWAVHGMNWPNYRRQFFLEKVNPRNYPEWTWDIEKRIFNPTPKELITPELQQRSALAQAKCRALWEIVYEISVSRYWLWRGPLLQETVLLTKQMQARRFRDAGYPEKDIISYPYVLQHAEISVLSAKDAADEILLKAQFDEEFLLWSEYVRLKHVKLLDAASDIDGVAVVLKSFRKDAYFKGAI